MLNAPGMIGTFGAATAPDGDAAPAPTPPSLLLEGGDHLLTESGDKLLLE